MEDAGKETINRDFCPPLRGRPVAFAPGEGRTGGRERVAREAIEEILSGAEAGEGAFRMLRTRVQLSEAGRERLEAEFGRLLRELNDPDAPPVDLIMLSVRQD
jgi:hypothetical protein